MATLVVYTVGQPLYIVGCRDMAARWVFRHIEVESNLVKRLMLAKYHDSWAYTETQGQTQAFERARANLYVAKMLRHFQNALKHLWHMPGCDNVRAKLQAIHVAARALQVPPPFVLHTVGQATFSEPEWIYCETAVDDDNKRYVHAYKFHTAQHESDPWKDLIHGFIHFAYQKSEENSLIAQLDCDGDGIISNLVCYPKLSHLGPVSEYTETVDKAFQHFKGEHECNKICNILALRQLDDV
ncbi:uncharacterized protein MELLADRAFT_115722 [Melampsora larici-populina 98AG31]|uniref:Alpha-type protein kinase domain-containing protein n=1 Tax=Melampsora larici-populina (strain 98AG31 / pathotype 3-4-7) TaxID=747676 RepID=F4RDA2_MELLP|nr:uncharacterized protein MELLADRAFT_115722 [Melampsora larici-populina 98AG31]EGG09366.1 hypothetical protein MELLADRAFT_115722 [Melampsora larici-populina 98AG31]